MIHPDQHSALAAGLTNELAKLRRCLRDARSELTRETLKQAAASQEHAPADAQPAPGGAEPSKLDLLEDEVAQYIKAIQRTEAAIAALNADRAQFNVAEIERQAKAHAQAAIEIGKRRVQAADALQAAIDQLALRMDDLQALNVQLQTELMGAARQLGVGVPDAALNVIQQSVAAHGAATCRVSLPLITRLRAVFLNRRALMLPAIDIQGGSDQAGDLRDFAQEELRDLEARLATWTVPDVVKQMTPQDDDAELTGFVASLTRAELENATGEAA